TAFGDDLDVAAAVAPFQCTELAGLDLNVFDGVEWDADIVAQAPAAAHHVGGIDPVDVEGIVGGPRAIYRRIQGLRAVCVLRTGCRREIDSTTRPIGKRRADAG